MAIVNCSKIKPKKRIADRGNPFGDLLVGDLLDPKQCREQELQEIKRMVFASRLKASGYRYLLLESFTYNDLRCLVEIRFDDESYNHYASGPVPTSVILNWFDLRWAILHPCKYGDPGDPIVCVTLSPSCISILRDYLNFCLGIMDCFDDADLIISCEEILKNLED